jgi:trimethylamine---corrinoid protein Co-methyltransferase
VDKYCIGQIEEEYLSQITPKFSMLSQDDCFRIHQASCQILHRTGVQVLSPAGLKLLIDAGAVVTENVARIPPSLVEWALGSSSGPFNLFRRGSDQVALKLDGKGVYFGPGSDTLRYLDPHTGERRDFQLDDIADCIRVCDALPEIGFVMSVGIPRDVPLELYYRYQFAAMIRNTFKPIVVVCNDRLDLEAITAMAAVVAGGMDRLSRYPTFLVYAEPSTPLRHSVEATEKLLFCAEHSIPVTHSPAPMMGGTAPVTLAGAVALGNAEMLSGLVMHQLKNPGAPFLYGHGVHNLDMKTMISVYGSPGYQLARVMAAEMGRFYSLPVWGYAAHSDSKALDGQAAIDAQFSVLVALLAGTNLNHDVGYLEAGLTNSPEYMVLTDEIISMNRSFTRGLVLDDETLALDAIHQVGPGGQFMNHDHTMAHWRELWVPHLFDRQRIDRWEQQGSKDINARLREKTLSILGEHKVEPLSDSVERDIDYILKG